ncbi:hypothetical protein SAMN03159423_2908 [Bradyrhizobium sp. NFR13]|uniref:hypothetical protein n=1 Tax=Bradyrhizobium sp. NFR13 TaxID=1566285 RepID=UPI0008E3DE61|nr:hypothetical protein [Bradyrhizobium sp. NFR13]SFL62392.1 hypothetical protein SAMN03159423_2908 [Bradyrhizobium sp. NFR13]
MRPMQRLVSAAVLVALSSALSGCGSMTGWDPSDLLDFLDTKKKLPGDRKPVFPDGVPGLEQGVPRDLYKGNVEQQQQTPPPPVAAAPPPAEPKGRKSKNRAAAAPSAAPADPDAAPVEEGSTAAAPPPPQGKKLARRRSTTAPPPDEPAAAAPAQQATTPFPAPVPSGSFSR